MKSSKFFISDPGMAAHIHMDQQTVYQYSPNSHVSVQLLYLQSLGRGETGCVYIVLFIDVQA